MLFGSWYVSGVREAVNCSILDLMCPKHLWDISSGKCLETIALKSVGFRKDLGYRYRDRGQWA